MGVEVDKMTVTFYGTEECRDIAVPFRALALKKYRSINDAMKEIIKEWIEKNKEITQ